MKLMKRNLQTVYYCLYEGEEKLTDSNNYKTGEKRLLYSDPVEIKCSVSSATGNAQVEIFGNLESYDKVLITDDMSCPIDEHTLLFVDKSPEFNSDGSPTADYLVKRVAKSLNNISYAISEVTIS